MKRFFKVNNIIRIFHRYYFVIFIVFLVFVSVLLRFINYQNRWGLAIDQARFAIHGLYSIRSMTLPMLGPFSSGGPFQTGGEWYWIVSIGYLLFPNVVYGPWIFMGVLSVFFVVFILITGYILGGKKFAIIAGILACMSPAQIAQSLSLSNQTPISLFSLLTVLFGLLYIQTSNIIFSFFVGLSVGLASSVHAQGLALIPVILILLLCRKPRFSEVLAIILGLGLPWLPVFIADSQNNFYNTQSMIQYYRVGQYAISLDVLGRNWKSFISTLLPHFWSFTIGNFSSVGIISIILSSFIGLIEIKNKHVSREWVYISCSLLSLLWIIRYAHVPLYDSFIVVLHPFILLVTAGIIVYIMKRYITIGLILLVIHIIGSLIKNSEEIKNSTNYSNTEAQKILTFMTSRFPNSKFSLYGSTESASHIQAFLYLYFYDLIDGSGKKIGLRGVNEKAESGAPLMNNVTDGIDLYDLDSSSHSAMVSSNWKEITAEFFHNDTESWFKK